jgi:VCBS repeat-containing protein
VTDLRSGTPDGIDTLKSIEKLQFTDTAVSLTTTVSLTANTIPIITSTAFSVKLTEWADGSTNETNNVAHKTSGTMTFWDPDLSDAHAGSFTAEATGYIGTFTVGPLDDVLDTLKWSFSVSDSALNFLGAGATLTQKYDVKISDGHGGSAVQTVTIALAGASDATTTTTATVAAAALGPDAQTESLITDDVAAWSDDNDGPVHFFGNNDGDVPGEPDESPGSPFGDDSPLLPGDAIGFMHASADQPIDSIAPDEESDSPFLDEAPAPSYEDIQSMHAANAALDQNYSAADHLQQAIHYWTFLI